MKYLLDTCLLSELPKASPNAGVVRWILEVEEDSLYVSALTLGEVRRGIARLEDGRRKESIQGWFDTHVLDRFKTRILAVDLDVCLCWGHISAAAERFGRPRPAVDSLIAACAIVHGLTLVTRNQKDFEHLPLPTLNPWT